MKSIWSLPLKSYPKLDSNIKTQVCVIGGGIAGYLTAYMLAQQKFEVVLLEANKIFQSTTVNTTAFITSLQDIVYSEIEKKDSLDLAKKYYQSQQYGISLIEELVSKNNIKCDFEKLTAYLFARGSTKNLEKEFKSLTNIKADVEYLKELKNLPIKVKGAIKIENQACFHPLKFLKGLPVNFQIYENSRVTQISFDLKEVVANNFTCKADYIVIATHFPIFNFPELLFTKMYQSSSYAQIYDSNLDLKGLYIEDIGNGLTFRNYDNKIIANGFDHRTGRVPKINQFDRLERAAREVCENTPIKAEWLAQDCMTFDHIPFASKISDYESCFVITGFNKWGMANSAVCAKLVCDLIEGKENEFEKLFSLNRVTMPNSPVKVASHMGVTCKSLFKSFFVLPFKNYKKLKNNTGGIFLVEGKKCGVFKDEYGNFYKVDSRCGHLGCELSFNNHTKTFDCECHGSRYDTRGEILNEPTVKSIKIN